MLPPLHEGQGLTLLLDSCDFDEWKDVVGRTLGDHRSRLTDEGQGFRARISMAEAGPLQLLHFHGQGVVELERVQGPQAGVFWMPFQGWSQERVNGQDVLAERGQALLLRPGDELLGFTSTRLEGVSILVPAHDLQPGLPSLVAMGQHHRLLMDAALTMVQCAVAGRDDSPLAAAAFLDGLKAWQLKEESLQQGRKERITSIRRREYIAAAREWIENHISEPFEIRDVAAAVGVSIRTLQYACLQELGRTPMEMAKYQRLQRLRQDLLNPELISLTIADLMVANGLLACGATAADYRRFCGESPRETRNRLPVSHKRRRHRLDGLT